MNTDSLVHSLSRKEIKYMQDAFFELFFIMAFHKNSKQRMKHYLLKKKNTNTGNVRKIFSLMLTGKDLQGGILSNVDDCLRDYAFTRKLK